MKKRFRTILILIFAGIFVFSAFRVYRQQREYAEGESAYTDIEQYISLNEDSEGKNGEREKETRPEEEDINWPTVDFAALSEINSDFAAWIYIEDTKINYPVVRGTDNQFYLKHLFDGKWNSSGCIFLDSRNAPDFSNRNSIIYGHNMKNGTMFAGLSEYKKQAFYEAHPVILLMTPEQNFRIEIFAGYVANVKDDTWKTDFSSDAEFVEWQESAKERSCFESEITPVATDRIVTLSTCSYEFNNARFVLLGVLKSAGSL